MKNFGLIFIMVFVTLTIWKITPIESQQPEAKEEQPKKKAASADVQEPKLKNLDEIRKLQKEDRKHIPTTAKEDFETYFPVQKGNLWEYRLTIPPGGSYSIIQWDSEGGNKIITSEEQGTSLEEYEIEDIIEDLPAKRRYKIDGKSLWGSLYWDVQVGDDMVQVDEVDKPSSVLLFGGIPKRRTIYFGGPPPPNSSKKLLQKDVVPTYKRHDKIYRVRVPAGEFSDCIEIIEEAKLKNGGLRTYSYYAPAIGIVLRYQTDLDGNPKSYMELVKYQIAHEEGNSRRKIPSNLAE